MKEKLVGIDLKAYPQRCVMKRQTHTRWSTGWLEFYLDDWVTFFGYSKKVRVDSEGARRSPETREVLKRLGIVLDSIPEEAHWQLGIAEVSLSWSGKPG